VYRPGDRIDVWVVEAALGSGGMGSVYRCHNHRATRILAAVKVLDSALRKFPEAEKRFVREADILGQLDHPNIVHVRNVRTDGDPPYLEMEFVAGESFDDRIRRGPAPYEVVLPMFRQCAEALAYLHARGICHRDLKPANVLVTRDGAVKLVDFGLAFEMDASRMTAEGTTFGTVSYAPPEWITPDKMDPMGWDIYALGTIVVELLHGTYAFPVSGTGTARQQAMQVVVAKQGHAPLDPGPAFPPELRVLVGEMTLSDPDRRLKDAAELVRRVKALPTVSNEPGVTVAPFVLPGELDPGVRAASATDSSMRPQSAPLRPAPQPPALDTMPINTLAPRAALAVGGAFGLLGLGSVALAVVLVGAAAWWMATRPPNTLPPEPAPVAVAAPVAEPSPPTPAVVTAPAPELVAPVAPATPPPKPDPAPTQPKVVPPRPSGKPGGFVTVGELAGYLDTDPKWKPGGQRATVAGASYLPDWTHAGPPPTVARTGAATGVTPELARSFCRGRGRDLPAFEPNVEDLEFRVSGTDVVVADGGAAPIKVRQAEARRSVKFRCTK